MSSIKIVVFNYLYFQYFYFLCNHFLLCFVLFRYAHWMNDRIMIARLTWSLPPLACRFVNKVTGFLPLGYADRCPLRSNLWIV